MKKHAAAASMKTTIVAVIGLFIVRVCSAANLPGPSVALVPLDNRPACLDYTVRIAHAAGAEIQTPPFAAIGAYIFHGDPEQTARWLDGLSPAPEFLIVSIDMLAFGGLVASRTDETGLDAAAARLEQLADFKKKNPGTVVFAFGVIQRIARTGTGDAGYDRVTALMSDYLKKADRAAAEKNLLLAAEVESLKAKIPADQLKSYLSARRRNHEINKSSIALAASGAIDFLVLGMDDNAVHGPQRLERDALEKEIARLGVGARVVIKPGADEAAHLLLARAVNLHHGWSPRIAARYYPADANRWIPDLEDRPLEHQVALNLLIAGFRPAEDGRGDAYLLIYGRSPGGGGDDPAGELAADAAALQRRGAAVGVADLRMVNQGTEALVDALIERTDVARLSAYSGWNTAGNALGTCVGHLAAEHALRRQAAAGAPGGRERAEAHLAFLLQRFLDDYLYMAVIRPEIHAGLLARGISQSNIPAREYRGFSGSLKGEVMKRSAEFFDKHFRGRSYAAGKDVFLIRDARFGVVIPWFRPFEIELDIRVAAEQAGL